jgi:hypothetical protein
VQDEFDGTMTGKFVPTGSGTGRVAREHNATFGDDGIRAD